MGEPKGEIIVGVLGQYASGKSEAARSLIRYLGGKDEAIFINDRELLTRLAVDHLLELDEAQVTSTMEEDGTQRLDGKLATIWLRRGEDLNTLDLDTLRWPECE
jgi:DNA helicase HerA-like ATPase